MIVDNVIVDSDSDGCVSSLSTTLSTITIYYPLFYRNRSPYAFAPAWRVKWSKAQDDEAPLLPVHLFAGCVEAAPEDRGDVGARRGVGRFGRKFRYSLKNPLFREVDRSAAIESCVK